MKRSFAFLFPRFFFSFGETGGIILTDLKRHQVSKYLGSLLYYE